MNKDLINKLTVSDDSACEFTGIILDESHKSNKWYCYFDDFVSLLNHKNSFVRNRIVYILAANARWDVDNKFEKIIDDFLVHVTDEKPITARQCIKSLVEVGESKTNLIPVILDRLNGVDLSKYKDSMKPLIEQDIKETKEKLMKLS